MSDDVLDLAAFDKVFKTFFAVRQSVIRSGFSHADASEIMNPVIVAYLRDAFVGADSARKVDTLIESLVESWKKP